MTHHPLQFSVETLCSSSAPVTGTHPPVPSPSSFKHPWLASMSYIVIMAVLVLWNASLVYVMATQLNMNDFGKFYYSIVAFLEGRAMYGPNPGTFLQVTPLMGQHFWNLNPPHFHWLLLPLGFWSPSIALALWGAMNLIAFIVSLRLIGQELQIDPTRWQARWIVSGLLAFAGTGALLVTGQLSCLLLLPITWAWICARKGRWNRAGIWLGLASSIKPFLLIMVPYFLLHRKIRPAIWCCTFWMLPYVGGFIGFGQDVYRQWIDRLLLVDWSWASMNASLHGLLHRTFHENPSFAIVVEFPNAFVTIWLIVSTAVVLIALAATARDDSTEAVDRAFAFLILSVILVFPLGWIYYLILPLGPLTALGIQWWRRLRPITGSPAPFSFKHMLVVLAAVGFLVPLPLTHTLQPNPLATITVGSIYCWSTMWLWTSLLLDFRNPRDRHRPFETATHERMPSMQGVSRPTPRGRGFAPHI